MMTLEKAIAHAEEVHRNEGIAACAVEHDQLAQWLKELVRARAALMRARAALKKIFETSEDNVSAAIAQDFLTLMEIHERGSEKREACPCLHTTPCIPRCTCAMPGSSSGCRRCCTYGSREQQRAAAERLAKQVDPPP